MATMTLPTENGLVDPEVSQAAAETVIEAAQRIAPIIIAHSDEAEREGRLSETVREAMLKAGLLNMLTPKSLGGLEIDPLTYAWVVETVANADSAAGWTLCNPLVFSWNCSRLPDRGAEEIFASDALIAAAINPPVKAVPVEGGYRLTGRTPFVSNCHDATWYCATAAVMDGDQPARRENGDPEMIRIFVPMHSCRIIPTWSVMGMKGTGSDDVEVNGVFVPSYRTNPLVPNAAVGAHYQGALYRFPPVGIVAGTAGPVMLGIARSAIAEVTTLAGAKTPLTSSSLLKDKAPTQEKLALAKAAVNSARALLRQTLSETWKQTLAGEAASKEQKADLMLAAVNAVHSSVAAVELMYEVAGTSAFYNGSPLERHFRDVQVLKQHGTSSIARYQSVGQVYLGMEPDFPLLRL